MFRTTRIEPGPSPGSVVIARTSPLEPAVDAVRIPSVTVSAELAICGSRIVRQIRQNAADAKARRGIVPNALTFTGRACSGFRTQMPSNSGSAFRRSSFSVIRDPELTTFATC